MLGMAEQVPTTQVLGKDIRLRNEHDHLLSSAEESSQAKAAPAGFATHSTRRIGDQEGITPGFIVSEVRSR